MVNNIYQNWKDILLKSGLPLEASIRKTIQKFGFNEPYEYNFVRKNIDGVENNFSVDFNVSKSVRLSPSSADFYIVKYLIECKYCSPDTNWVFAPNNYEISERLSLICEAYDTQYNLNSNYWNEFMIYPLVYKGVSIKSKGSDSCQITTAYNQLSYGYISALFEHLTYSNRSIFIIPIVVTTANLWQIKESVTIEEIQNCKNIEDVCQKSDVLLSQMYPDNLMRRYYIDSFNAIEDNQKKFLIDCLCKNYSCSINEIIESEAIFNPDSFLFISYKAFEEKFKELNDYFLNPKILEKRKSTYAC